MTTGGPVCTLLFEIMSQAVPPVNNTRSTVTPLTPRCSRLNPVPADPSLSSLWISSPIFLCPMVLILFWSWKGVILEPCHKTIDAMGTASILLNSLCRRYGLPDKAISDRGPQFAAHVFKELGRLLQINLAMSTAHHPQTDGATERANQEIEAYLSIFCCNNPETW